MDSAKAQMDFRVNLGLLSLALIGEYLGCVAYNVEKPMISYSKIPKNPYLGYDAREAVRSALACLECPTPAPCTTFCAQGVNIPKVMYWVGMAACEGLVLSRWLMNEEEVEAARIADQICDSYN